MDALASLNSPEALSGGTKYINKYGGKHATIFLRQEIGSSPKNGALTIRWFFRVVNSETLPPGSEVVFSTNKGRFDFDRMTRLMTAELSGKDPTDQSVDWVAELKANEGTKREGLKMGFQVGPEQSTESGKTYRDMVFKAV